MIREIEINNTKIRYDLQYKKVKNINLRIKPDGSINVSANRRVPQKAIDEFVMSKAEFIIRALDKYKNKSNEASKQIYSETELKELILSLCEKVYPYFEKRGIKYPTIKFRKMISQWGNCRSEKCVLCHPSKNGRRKASKNGMNRSLSFVFEIRPHLFHGSLDNEPLPT